MSDLRNHPIDSVRLEACPFCGGRDIRPCGPYGPDSERECFYQCHDCTTTGPNGADWESATLQWNTRNKPEAEEPPKRDLPKLKPCLRCDRKFLTTPESRICGNCSATIRDFNLNGGVDSKKV